MNTIFSINEFCSCGKWLRNAILFISSLGLALFSSISFAVYQYTYTGNTITGTLLQYEYNAPEPYISTKEFTGEIFLQFSSPTLLTGPIDINDIDSFTMAGERTPNFETYPDVKGSLAYPGPFQNPTYHTTAEFNIFAIDANGLPTNWNISISGNLGGTRHTYPTFSSTPFSDKIFGYSEYGYEWTAELNNNPGQWRVTSVVPEPETYVMLLAGLGLIGFVYKRKKIF